MAVQAVHCTTPTNGQPQVSHSQKQRPASVIAKKDTRVVVTTTAESHTCPSENVLARCSIYNVIFICHTQSVPHTYAHSHNIDECKFAAVSWCPLDVIQFRNFVQIGRAVCAARPPSCKRCIMQFATKPLHRCKIATRKCLGLAHRWTRSCSIVSKWNYFWGTL